MNAMEQLELHASVVDGKDTTPRRRQYRRKARSESDDSDGENDDSENVAPCRQQGRANVHDARCRPVTDDDQTASQLCVVVNRMSISDDIDEGGTTARGKGGSPSCVPCAASDDKAQEKQLRRQAKDLRKQEKKAKARAEKLEKRELKLEKKDLKHERKRLEHDAKRMERAMRELAASNAELQRQVQEAPPPPSPRSPQRHRRYQTQTHAHAGSPAAGMHAEASTAAAAAAAAATAQAHAQAQAQAHAQAHARPEWRQALAAPSLLLLDTSACLALGAGTLGRWAHVLHAAGRDDVQLLVPGAVLRELDHLKTKDKDAGTDAGQDEDAGRARSVAQAARDLNRFLAEQLAGDGAGGASSGGPSPRISSPRRTGRSGTGAPTAAAAAAAAAQLRQRTWPVFRYTRTNARHLPTTFD
jgi:hypothetical protein